MSRRPLPDNLPPVGVSREQAAAFVGIKAGATVAAENGATDEELMAIFGWTTKAQ